MKIILNGSLGLMNNKKMDGEMMMANSFFKEYKTNDWGKVNWEKHKDGFLGGKVSWETWKLYFENHKKEIVAEYDEVRTPNNEIIKRKEEDEEKKKKDKKELSVFTRRGQVENFWEEQPFYFDSSKIFWLWDKENFKWIRSDETDFCNLIYEKLGIETISSKSKGELTEAFRQVGRKHKPEDVEKTWVQFKNKIYDVKNGECFDASPKYFITNPIPWSVGEIEDTPTIDKFLSEWVNKKWVETLYQIIAYNISSDKFMQRIIGLCGGGSNGKGTFIKLNYKFLGEENCVSSEIKNLSQDKFEPAVLYKKLLCVMGEVSYDDLKNTNQLKKLGGEDKISFQFKGKTPFTDDNTATCCCQTNSMPITPDKSIGFYRKWLLIDFPNQFKQVKENLIEKIPDAEFENLAKKSLRILKELYNDPKFINEGDFNERMKRYEERSNPVMRYVEDYCEEQVGKNLPLRVFSNICNQYLKIKHLRIMSAIQIGKILREEGFSVSQRKVDGNSSVVILNLCIKKPLEPLEPLEVELVASGKKTSRNVGGLDGFNGNSPQEILDTTTKKIPTT